MFTKASLCKTFIVKEMYKTKVHWPLFGLEVTGVCGLQLALRFPRSCEPVFPSWWISFSNIIYVDIILRSQTDLLCTSWSWSIRFLLSRKCCLLVVRILRHVDVNWFPCFLWHVWRGFKAKVTSRCFPVSLGRCSTLGFVNFIKWDWWTSLPYHSQCIDYFYWGSVQLLWLWKRDLAMRDISEPLPSRSFCLW